MGLNNVLLISQITGHIVALVLSVCVIIPMWLHNSKFNNHCGLFMVGEWDEVDGLYHIKSTNAAYCDFPIFTGIFVFCVSFVQIYRFSLLAYRKEEGKFLGLFLDVCFGTLMFIMTIVSAFFITLGFMHFCNDMTRSFQSCGQAAGQNITQDTEKIDTSGFYVEMGTAQFGIWGSFAACVIVGVVACLKLINEHQMQNMKVSMYLERQRLVHGETSSLADSLNSTPASPTITASSGAGKAGEAIVPSTDDVMMDGAVTSGHNPEA